MQPIRSRLSAAPTGARARRTISPISPIPLRDSRCRRVPPPGRDLQHVPGLCRQSRLRAQPPLQQRIRDADLILAVGPRLGEATTDGYTLITPEHPGQTLIHVHPDPNELGRVYHADLPICADMGEFSEMVDEWIDPDLVRFSCGEAAHREWLDWSEPKPRDGVKLDLGPCVAAMRDRSRKTPSSATAPAISPAGGTAIGATAQCRPSSRRPAGRWATALRQRSPRRCASRTGLSSRSPATATS